jgi:hypothetical protein
MPDRPRYPALQDLAGLWLAESAPELWQRLVWTSGLAPSANHWDAVALFRKFHDEGQPRAMDTALLLCTDYRWADASGRLVAEVASSGILTEEQLVLLAEEFLQDPIRWVLPEELAGGPWVDTLLAEADGAGMERASAGPGRSSPGQPIWIARRGNPPLRRWAAATLLGRDVARLGGLLGRAEELSAREAAFVIAGAIDARDAFDDGGADRLIELGLNSRAGWVRLLALQAVADRDGLGVAQHRAARDRSATVRAWAERLHPAASGARTPETTDTPGAPRPAPPAGAGGAKTVRKPPPPLAEPADQPSLFDL